MCNKTCNPPLLIVGDLVSTFKTPTKRTSLTPCYNNIRTLFPVVAHARIPQELAMDQMMEEEIALQSKEEQPTTARVQVLKEKSAAAVREKIAKEKEVRWVTDAVPGISPGSPDVFMEDSPKTRMEDADTGVSAGYNRGSKYHKASNIDWLNAQQKEQERQADTAQAYASSLQVPTAGNAQYDTLVPLDGSPVVVDIPRAETMSRTLTPSGVFWQSNLLLDQAMLRRDSRARFQPNASPMTTVSTISRLSLRTTPAPERNCTLNPLRYSAVPHHDLPINKVDESPALNMY
jgi:hypothetical protein